MYIREKLHVFFFGFLRLGPLLSEILARGLDVDQGQADDDDDEAPLTPPPSPFSFIRIRRNNCFTHGNFWILGRFFFQFFFFLFFFFKF